MTPILRTGWAGVDLFFVLSGFVLMLVHERDFPCLAWAPAARFAWLRFFRVYPLATAVLLLILLLTLLDPRFTAYWAHSAIPHNFTVSSFFRTLALANRWWSPTDGDWNQPEWSLSVEILGYVGFDFLYADQMFTSIGWSELANLVRAAQGSRMAVLARVENDPWHSADDPGVASRVARALALGCDGVKVNVFSKTEARWAIDAGSSWHNRPYIARFVVADASTPDAFRRAGERRR